MWLSAAAVAGLALLASWLALAGGAGASRAPAPARATAQPVTAPFAPSKFNKAANLARCGGFGGYWNWYYCNDPAVVGCLRFTNGTCGEYGVDVNLPAGTPIYAPEAGTISRDGPCSPPNYSCWVPGRVRLKADAGDTYPGVLGFGHVRFVGPTGHVAAGTEIATVANQKLYGTGWSDHVEFMYSPSGSLSQSAFTGGCTSARARAARPRPTPTRPGRSCSRSRAASPRRRRDATSS